MHPRQPGRQGWLLLPIFMLTMVTTRAQQGHLLMHRGQQGLTCSCMECDTTCAGALASCRSAWHVGTASNCPTCSDSNCRLQALLHLGAERGHAGRNEGLQVVGIQLEGRGNAVQLLSSHLASHLVPLCNAQGVDASIQQPLRLLQQGACTAMTGSARSMAISLPASARYLHSNSRLSTDALQ